MINFLISLAGKFKLAMLRLLFAMVAAEQVAESGTCTEDHGQA